MGETFFARLGVGSDRKGRLQKISCFKAGDETGVGGYQEQQKRCSFPFNHSNALGGEALWRTGDACWDGESGTKQQVLGGRLGGIRMGFIRDRRWGSRKDCQGFSTAELEKKEEKKKQPGDWIWEKSERRENLQAAYLVFW